MYPDENKIEKIANNDSEVILIAGKINKTGRVFYWEHKLGEFIKIGDYAIVENMNGFDLIEVVGKVITKRKWVNKFSNTKYENMKKVIQKIEIDI